MACVEPRLSNAAKPLVWAALSLALLPHLEYYKKDAFIASNIRSETIHPSISLNASIDEATEATASNIADKEPVNLSIRKSKSLEEYQDMPKSHLIKNRTSTSLTNISLRKSAESQVDLEIKKTSTKLYETVSRESLRSLLGPKVEIGTEALEDLKRHVQLQCSTVPVSRVHDQAVPDQQETDNQIDNTYKANIIDQVKPI